MKKIDLLFMTLTLLFAVMFIACQKEENYQEIQSAVQIDNRDSDFRQNGLCTESGCDEFFVADIPGSTNPPGVNIQWSGDFGNCSICLTCPFTYNFTHVTSGTEFSLSNLNYSNLNQQVILPQCGRYKVEIYNGNNLISTRCVITKSKP